MYDTMWKSKQPWLKADTTAQIHIERLNIADSSRSSYQYLIKVKNVYYLSVQFTHYYFQIFWKGKHDMTDFMPSVVRWAGVLIFKNAVWRCWFACQFLWLGQFACSILSYLMCTVRTILYRYAAIHGARTSRAKSCHGPINVCVQKIFYPLWYRI